MLTPVKAGENVAFAAGFSMMWGELRNKLGTPVRHERQEVKWMNNSLTAVDLMGGKNEVKIDGPRISLQTTFKKDLPFSTPMQEIGKPLLFNGKQVKAFGMEQHDPGIVQEMGLAYYKDKDHLVVVLHPADKESVIILAKGFNKGTSLHLLWQQVQGAMRKGTPVSAIHSLRVPMLDLEVDVAYKEFEGISFKAKGQDYTINKATQHVVFTLDQHGGKGADHSEISADNGGVKADLNFDKPFMVILQKTKSALPYFMLKVETADVMQSF
jgi:hypothetical protein